MEQNYLSLCDYRFDKEFDKVESLKRYPWVGSQYFDSNCRILILGDSHYTVDKDKNKNEEEYKRCNSNKDYTREVVRCVINDVCKGESTWKMFRNLINTLTSYTPEEVNYLWSKVAFYNFIQEPMKQINQRPTSEESRIGWHCFYHVINILKPSFCLFIGKRCEKKIETIESLGGVFTRYQGDMCNKTSPVFGEVETKERTKTRYTIINHTSIRGYSPDAWYQYLCKKEPKVMIQLDRNLKK